MKLRTKTEALRYLGFYMSLLVAHIAMFGMYGSNYFILLNKIILLNHYNEINRSELESIYLTSDLLYFENVGFNIKYLIGLENLNTENLN